MVMSLFFILAHIPGALTSVRAIMETRTAQGAIAWAISLNTFPVVSVPAYWGFGRSKFEGYVSARRTERAKVAGRSEEYMRKLVERELIAQPARDRALLVEKLAKLPFTTKNDAELLIDGEATFRSIFEGIDQAKEYVLVQFYILHDDDIGKQLKDRLLARAREGIKVRVLYDEIGSGNIAKVWGPDFKACGAEIVPFNSTKGSTNRFQLNFRNHRKIVVVDGLVAWVGGHNVGDEYLGKDPKVGAWRDTHVKLEGPVVDSVQIAFAEDWNWATGTMPDLNFDPKPAASGASMDIMCLPSGPDDPLETCTLFNLHAIASAKTRLWISSPYFVPDEQFISALQLAALRGVDVRVIVPDKSDNKMVELSGWSYVEELERVGIKFYRHQKGFMHQKVMLIDDEGCTIGTANFDNRSFRLNFEITIAIHDRGFTDQVRKMLEKDLSDSRLVRAEEVQSRGFWSRFAIRASRLMAPVQ
ncbi:MAG: cardiolipin synthase [Verrucomicrobiales bacterium]